MKAILRLIKILLLSVGALVVTFAVVAVIYNRIVHYQSTLTAWPQESDFVGPVAWDPDNPDQVRILSIDGGGIAGVVYLEMLKYLEEQSGRPISELFDFVTGPSTGSIVAAGLLLRGDDGAPEYSAEEMIDVYTEFGQGVLQAPLYHRILTLNGFLGPRLFNHTEVALAHELFGGARFGELIRPAMIPVFSVAEGGFVLLRNWVEPEANMLLGPLVAAATAAPTYFPSVRLEGHDDYAGVYADAAIVLNNPSHRAFLAAVARYPNAELVLVSFGMRTSRDPEIWEKVNGGGLNWLKPILTLVFNGQDDINLAALADLGDVGTSFDLKAFRLAPEIPWTWDIMDGSDANIERLRSAARDYIDDNRQKFDSVADLLDRASTSAGAAQ